jgi:putative transposase
MRMLLGVVTRFEWRCLAYCLMPNHVHLLIETTKPNLGRGMHALHGPYATHFNTRYDRAGHLFQSRFGSRFLEDEVHVARVFSYIAANPVAASLCAHPEDWEWSSYDATVSVARHPLLDLARLRAFLHAADTCALAAVRDRLVSAGLLLPG